MSIVTLSSAGSDSLPAVSINLKVMLAVGQ